MNFKILFRFPEKAANELAGELENIKFDNDDYDFKTDFTPA
jgi:hypothetical protein